MRLFALAFVERVVFRGLVHPAMDCVAKQNTRISILIVGILIFTGSIVGDETESSAFSAAAQIGETQKYRWIVDIEKKTFDQEILNSASTHRDGSIGEWECASVECIVLIGPAEQTNSFNASPNIVDSRKIMITRIARCVHTVYAIDITNPTDMLMNDIGLSMQNPSMSIKEVSFRGKYDGNGRLHTLMPATTSVCIEGACHAFIDNATQIEMLTMLNTDLQPQEFVAIVDQHPHLHSYDIEGRHEDYQLMHAIIAHMRRFRVLRICNTGDSKPAEIIVYGEQNVVKTNDLGLAVVCSDEHTLVFMHDPKMYYGDSVDIRQLGGFFADRQFEFLSIVSTDYQVCAVLQEDSPPGISALEVAVNGHTMLAMNTQIAMNVDDNQMIAHIPKGKRSSLIFVDIAKQSNALAVLDLFDPTNNDAKCWVTLTVVRKPVATLHQGQARADHHKQLSKSLLNVLARSTAHSGAPKINSRTYRTCIFTEDSMDVYDWLLTKSMNLQQFYMTADDTESDILKIRQSHLQHLELRDWHFQLSEHENCIIGTKETVWPNSQALADMHPAVTLNLIDGTLQHMNELIWRIDIDDTIKTQYDDDGDDVGDRSCTNFARIEIICPSDYSKARFSEVAKKWLGQVSKCIGSHVEMLSLIAPTEHLLEIIRMTNILQSKVQRFNIVNPVDIKWKLADILPNLERLSCVGTTSRHLSGIKRLEHLHCSGSELTQFSELEQVVQLFVLLNDAVEFDHVLAYLNNNPALIDALQGIHLTYTASEDMQIHSIISRTRKVLQKQHLTIVEQNAGVQFAYSGARLRTSDVGLIEEYNADIGKLHITNITKDYIADPLYAYVNEHKPKQLILEGDCLEKLESIFVSSCVQNLPTVTVQHHHDRLCRAHLFKNGSVSGTINRLDVYTEQLMSKIGDNMAYLVIYMHTNDQTLRHKAANGILSSSALECLYIGSDHGLYETIMTKYIHVQHLEKLKILNVSIGAASYSGRQSDLSNRVEHLIIRNDGRRLTKVREYLATLHRRTGVILQQDSPYGIVGFEIAVNDCTIFGMYDSNRVDSVKTPHELKSMWIFAAIDVQWNVLTLRDLFDLKNNDPRPWNAITVARKRIVRFDPTEINHTEMQLTKSLLNVLAKLPTEPSSPIINVREYKTSIFSEDSMDVYDWLLTQSISLQQFYMTADDNEKDMLKIGQTHLKELELLEWNFEISEGKNCLIGTQASAWPNGQALADMPDCTLNLGDGTLQNISGELLWHMDSDNIVSYNDDSDSCADFVRIEIICPSDYSKVQSSAMIENWMTKVKQCIRSETKLLSLISPRKELLVSIDMANNEPTEIERLNIINPYDIELDLVKVFPNLKRLCCAGIELRHFEVKHLEHLHCLGSDLIGQVKLQEIGNLSVLLDKMEFFDITRLLRDISHEKLQTLHLTYVAHKHMALVDLMADSVINIVHVPQLTIAQLNTGVELAYDRNLSKLLMCWTGTDPEDRIRQLELLLEFEVKKLQIVKIDKKTNIKRLCNWLQARPEFDRLSFAGDNFDALENLFFFNHIQNYPAVIMRYNNDRFSRKLEKQDGAMEIVTFRIDVYTECLLPLITELMVNVEIFVHSSASTLCDKIADKLLACHSLKSLYIGSDNGLFSAIVRKYSRATHWKQLIILNVSREAVPNMPAEPNLMIRVEDRLIMRNDNLGTSRAIERYRYEEDLRLKISHCSWSVELEQPSHDIIFKHMGVAEKCMYSELG